jgi:hypothetical protein
VYFIATYENTAQTGRGDGRFSAVETKTAARTITYMKAKTIMFLDDAERLLAEAGEADPRLASERDHQSVRGDIDQLRLRLQEPVAKDASELEFCDALLEEASAVWRKAFDERASVLQGTASTPQDNAGKSVE